MRRCVGPTQVSDGGEPGILPLFATTKAGYNAQYQALEARMTKAGITEGE